MAQLFPRDWRFPTETRTLCSTWLASSELERKAIEEELVCMAFGKDGQMTKGKHWKIW